MRNGLVIKLAADLRVFTDSLDFRAENEVLRRSRIKERLDAETVAIEKKFFLAPVPNCDREHSVELIRESNSVLFIGVNNGLGVTCSLEPVTLRFEFAS